MARCYRSDTLHSSPGIEWTASSSPAASTRSGSHNVPVITPSVVSGWSVDEFGVGDVGAVNEALSEDAGVRLEVYVAGGTDQTILDRAEMYSLTTIGVPFIDWLTAFVDGEAPGDVVCDGDCGRPAG